MFFRNKLKSDYYKKYVGHYVKRFYTPFDEDNIYKIDGYRKVIYFDNGKQRKPNPEFLYVKDKKERWLDVDDSVIITNEIPIVKDNRIANTSDPRYKGFNPFTKININNTLHEK